VRRPRPEQMIGRLETAAELDPLAAAVSGYWQRVLRPRVLRDLLSGRQVGHPLHPALVMVTGGALFGATALDVTGKATRVAAQRLIAVGLLSATPTVLAGWSDWGDTEQAEKRVGLVHAATNTFALTAYGLSWWQRRRGGTGTTPSVVGAVAIGLGGWLGGHLVFAQGVGVDTTAFQSGPTRWTDVAATSRVTAGLRAVDVDGVSVLLTRVDDRVVAIADRCTHRGGPLSDGTRDGDCVRCPWHGSDFDLATGSVRRGPASRPQPMYEVRERSGRIEIRRQDPRALRTNPV
jgi:nitrite reductase/ring-hydroxylating ferredoxin subunit